MAFPSLKQNSIPSLPGLATRKDSSIKTLASLQFERSAPKISLSGGSKISRRDSLSYVTSTLLLTSFIQPELANARITRPEIKRKIMEKLEQLREKAGLKKKDKTAPKEEKTLPKLEKKNGSKLPKEEKKEPGSDSKKQPKLVGASF